MNLPLEGGSVYGSAASDLERLIESLVEHYREQLRNGAPPHRHELVRQYPEVADRLEPRLRVVELLVGCGPAPGTSSETVDTTVKVQMNLGSAGPKSAEGC